MCLAENAYGGYQTRQRAPVVLPSASRAARGGLAVDDESIPRRPPFTAHISNLPYDVDESAITELFTGLKVLQPFYSLKMTLLWLDNLDDV